MVFRSLTRDDLALIINIELSQVQERLRERGLDVVLSDEAREYLINKGYHPEFGARPLRRAIEQEIEDQLAEELLRGSFKEKPVIQIGVRDGHLYFEGTAPEELTGIEDPVEPVGAGASCEGGNGGNQNGDGD